MKLASVAGFLKSRLVPVGSTLLHQSWHLTQGAVEAGTNYATRSLIPVTSRSGHYHIFRSFVVKIIQCPLDIATLDIAVALPIATSTPVTNLHQYINSDLGYNDLKF